MKENWHLINNWPKGNEFYWLFAKGQHSSVRVQLSSSVLGGNRQGLCWFITKYFSKYLMMKSHNKHVSSEMKHGLSPAQSFLSPWLSFRNKVRFDWSIFCVEVMLSFQEELTGIYLWVIQKREEPWSIYRWTLLNKNGKTKDYRLLELTSKEYSSLPQNKTHFRSEASWDIESLL